MEAFLKRKALALLSGGLDSTLAARLILEQGIEVEGLNFFSIFCTCTPKGDGCMASRKTADLLGIKLKIMDISSEYLDIVRKPKYGYGSQMNPCLDCRIFKFRKAYRYMKKVDASFIITGEVLGQRPMSQRKKAMKLIDKESNLEGLILRPLSAKFFKPTKPEKEGLVDRDRLLKIQGRSRKPQMNLAKRFNIKDYPCPSGGCRLTEPGFARRMKDLIKHQPDFNIQAVKLLKIGRHFRINSEYKLVVGRNEKENKDLEKLKRKGYLFFSPQNTKGPVGIGIGNSKTKEINLSSKIIARYSYTNERGETDITCQKYIDRNFKLKKITPLEEEQLAVLRI